MTYLLSLTEGQGIPCPSRLLLHLPCPGCGLTRSWIALWQGEFLTSIRFHPLGLPLFLVCVAVSVAALIHRFHPALNVPLSFQQILFHRRTLQAMTVLLLGVWGMRLMLGFAGNHYFIW